MGAEPQHPVEAGATEQRLVSLRGIAMRFGATRAVDGVDLDLEPARSPRADRGERRRQVDADARARRIFPRLRRRDLDRRAGASDSRPAEARRQAWRSCIRSSASCPSSPSPRTSCSAASREEPCRAGQLRPNEAGRPGGPPSEMRHLDRPGVKLESLSIAERQLVEIVKGRGVRAARAHSRRADLLAHHPRDARALSRLCAAASRGTAVVYISHKLDEIFAIADRVTVLRDGRKVATAPIGEWSEADPRPRDGRPRSCRSLFPACARDAGRGAPRGSRAGRATAFSGPVTFTMRAGEIVGLYGIIGAGRPMLAEALFGLAPADAEGRSDRRSGGRQSARRRRRSRAGVAMAPEDRHRLGPRADAVRLDQHVAERAAALATARLRQPGPPSRQRRGALETLARTGALARAGIARSRAAISKRSSSAAR